jgi:hypothetical protein
MVVDMDEKRSCYESGSTEDQSAWRRILAASRRMKHRTRGRSSAENESERHPVEGVNGPGDGRIGETAHRGERPSRDSAPKAGSYSKALRGRED